MSASDILTEMLGNMPESYQKTIGFPTYDLLAAVSLRMEGTDTTIDEAKQQLDPENLHDSALDRYIYPRSGLERKAATFAHGSLTVTGTGTVEQGTLFESGGGVQYYATETVAIEGDDTVPVTCTVDGTAGNLPAHSVTQMPVAVQGIASCDNPEPIGGGYAEESDSEYYARYLVVLRTPATSGNVYHYVQWALEVAGVGHVKVFPRVQGANTVDVVIADNAGQPASPALVKSVQDFIDPDSEGAGRGQAPIGAQCFVTAATGKAITVSCTVSKSDTDKPVVRPSFKIDIFPAEGNAACGGARERSIDVDVWYYPAERVEYLEECSEMAERLIAALETGIDTGEIVLVPDDTVSTTISLGVLVLQFALSWCESAAETGEMMENLEY